MTGNEFEAKATLEENERGAVRFEVKNIGTKTSEDWTFSITLPSGFTYSSEEEAPLKPNERAVFTLGFNVSDAPEVATIKASVTEETDTNKENNSFTWSVKITE